MERYAFHIGMPSCYKTRGPISNRDGGREIGEYIPKSPRMSLSRQCAVCCAEKRYPISKNVLYYRH